MISSKSGKVWAASEARSLSGSFRLPIVGKISEKFLSSYIFLDWLTLSAGALSEIPEETFSDWPAIFLFGVRLSCPCPRTYHYPHVPFLIRMLSSGEYEYQRASR